MLSHHEMKKARDAGRARPLTQAIPEFVRYWGDWWVSSADGWLRITDTHLASRLDAVCQRLDIEAEEQACLRAQAHAADRKEELPWLPRHARALRPHRQRARARTRHRAQRQPSPAGSPLSSSSLIPSRDGTCYVTA
jgi:hypothetical protein